MKTKIWIAIIVVAIVAGAFWVDDSWQLPSFNFNNDYTYTFKVDTVTSHEKSCRLRYTVTRSDGKFWTRSETVIIVGKTTGYNQIVTQNNVKDFKCEINSDCQPEIKKDDVWTITEKVYLYTIQTDFLKERKVRGPHFVIRCVAIDVTFTDPETGKQFTSTNDLKLEVTKNIVEDHYRLDNYLGKYLGTYVLNFAAVYNGKKIYDIKTESNLYKSY